MVIDRAVIGAVLLKRSCCSVNHPLLFATTGVAVTDPPPPPELTVSAIGTLRLIEPDVPVTVTVALPKLAVLEADKVSVVLAPFVAGGLNVAVTPLGKPLAANDTVPANPPTRVMLTATVPLAERLTLNVDGFADSEKS